MKNRVSPQDICLPQEARDVLNRLNQAGFEAYLVGGWVRDALLQRLTNDIDVTTNARPDQIQALFTEYPHSEVGKDHGTIGVKMNGQWIEITTYRIDQEIHDHRHPKSVQFTQDLKEDVLRRDFTINALAMNAQLEILDYVQGLKDLEMKCIRCVGDPQLRFKEDALRILRGLRLSAQLEFELEASTLQAMYVHAPLLQKLAVERILTEFSLWMSSAHPSRTLLNALTIVAEFIPEIRQANPLWLNQLDELTSLQQRWMTLFYAADVDSVRHRLHALKVPHVFRNNLLKHLECVHTEVCLDKISVKRLAHQFSKECIEDCFQFQKRFNCPNYSSDAHVIFKQIIEEEACVKVSALNIKGHDLVSLGFKNKAIQEALDACLEAVMVEDIPNTHEALMAYAQSLIT